MSPQARRDSSSLTECFEPRLRTYARLPKRRLDSLRRAILARSPVHFFAGDMRRDYGWTRTLVVAGVTLAAVGFGIRLVLTGLFATLVSPNLPLLVLFNLCVTLLLGRALLDRLETEPRTRRRVVRAPTWWVRATKPSTTPLQTLDRPRAYAERPTTTSHDWHRRRDS